MSDFALPPDPQNVSQRPLTKGMISDIVSNGLPMGAFTDIQGYTVEPNGLRRRGGWIAITQVKYPSKLLFADERIEAVIARSTPSGARDNLIITNKTMYQYDFKGNFYYIPYQRIYNNTSLATIYLNDITGSYSFLSDGITANKDFVLIENGTNHELRTIVNVTATQLTLDQTPALAFTTFKIIRTFEHNYQDANFVSYTQAFNKIYLTDGSSRGPQFYDGSVIQPHVMYNSQATMVMSAARFVTFHGGRLFYCNTQESAAYAPQRVRWTAAGNLALSESAWYQDLTGTIGEIIGIKPMSNMIIAYLQDGIFYGKSSNVAGLPYAFQRIDTGGSSAVGQKAFCSWIDSQFFVGPTDIYVVSADGGISPVGTTIASRSVLHPDCKLNYSQVVADPDRQRIIFGFAFGSAKQINKLFIYNLKTQAWSYENTESSDFIAVSTSSLSTRWADFANDHITGEWQQQTIRWFQGSQLSFTNYLFTQRADGYLYIYNETASQDQLPDGTLVPVQVEFQTGDFDFGESDLNKTVTRISLKLSDPYTRLTPIVIDVFGSTTRGRSWKFLGQMRILGIPDDEDVVNFRLTGSLVRFKFRTTSITVPYEVTEYVIRVTGRGLESSRRGTTD